jgi:multiple sugar transport system permease protein
MVKTTDRFSSKVVTLPAGRHGRRRALALGGRGIVLLAFAIFFCVPLVWLVLAPTRTDYQLETGFPLAFGSFHTVAVAWQRLDAFDDHVFRRWMENSLLYTLSATAIALVTTIPAGYGLAFGRFRGRKVLLVLTMIAMVMPATALVLPIFLELNAVSLIGSPLSVVLPFAFFPFGVFIAYFYFATALPPGLLEAARVDGCGDWQTFVRVGLPLAKPIVALVFFFSFVADWTNFFLPYIVLPDSSQFTVQTGLFDMLLGGSRGELALAALIGWMPLILVYVLSQRALLRGLASGAETG